MTDELFKYIHQTVHKETHPTPRMSTFADLKVTEYTENHANQLCNDLNAIWSVPGLMQTKHVLRLKEDLANTSGSFEPKHVTGLVLHGGFAPPRCTGDKTVAADKVVQLVRFVVDWDGKVEGDDHVKFEVDSDAGPDDQENDDEEAFAVTVARGAAYIVARRVLPIFAFYVWASVCSSMAREKLDEALAGIESVEDFVTKISASESAAERIILGEAVIEALASLFDLLMLKRRSIEQEGDEKGKTADEELFGVVPYLDQWPERTIVELRAFLRLFV